MDDSFLDDSFISDLKTKASVVRDAFAIAAWEGLPSTWAREIAELLPAILDAVVRLRDRAPASAATSVSTSAAKAAPVEPVETDPVAAKDVASIFAAVDDLARRRFEELIGPAEGMPDAIREQFRRAREGAFRLGYKAGMIDLGAALRTSASEQL